MKNTEENLKLEAAYQDMKFENSPRKKAGMFYHDLSTEYTKRCKDELIGDLTNKKVLDLGCGKGDVSLNALRSGAIVTAIDISPKSIEFQKKKAKKAHLEKNFHAAVMDAHHLEFENETFDIIIGNGILHHIPDLEQALREINRVLKPSGYAVFHEPLGMNPILGIFRFLTPNWRTPDEQPFRMKELYLIKKYFSNTEYTFFDCATLLSKLFIAMGLNQSTIDTQKRLISIDEKLLRNKKNAKITFLQKMSWTILIKLKK